MKKKLMSVLLAAALVLGVFGVSNAEPAGGGGTEAAQGVVQPGGESGEAPEASQPVEVEETPDILTQPEPGTEADPVSSETPDVLPEAHATEGPEALVRLNVPSTGGMDGEAEASRTTVPEGQTDATLQATAANDAREMGDWPVVVKTADGAVTGYEGLKEAVAAANSGADGAVVTVSEDCVWAAQYTDNGSYTNITKKMTVDGKGHTVKTTGRLAVSSNLTLKDIVLDGDNKIGSSGIAVKDQATLTLESGVKIMHSAAFSGPSAGAVQIGGGGGTPGTLVMEDGAVITENINSGVYVGDGSVFRFNGGEISGNKCTAAANSKIAYGIYMAAGGSVVMNGGKISGNGSTIGGGGIALGGEGCRLEINGGEVSGNTKFGGIYTTGKNCVLNLNHAVITGNSGTYGGIGGSGSAAGMIVNIAGNTQITGNKYGSAACNLKLAANISVNITGDASGANIGFTPAGTSKGQMVAAAEKAKWLDASAFVPDKTLAANVSAVKVGNSILTGYATAVSASGLAKAAFDYTGAPPEISVQDVAVTAAGGTVVTDPEIQLEHYADDGGQPGILLEEAPSAAGTYWARPAYGGNLEDFYGSSRGEAYQYRIVIPVSGIALDRVEMTLEEGEEAVLTAEVMPEDAADKNVAWSTSDGSVASVENGTVTAKSPGMATITATAANGMTAACRVTVAVPVETVSLSNAAISLDMGTTGRLAARALPDAAADKSIVWASSNTAVLTVDENGVLTPVAPGTATVTAASKNGRKASCTVQVVEPPETKPALPGTEGRLQMVVEPQVKKNTVEAEVIAEAVANAGAKETVVVKVGAKNSADIKVEGSVVEAAANAAQNGGAQALAFSMEDEAGRVRASVTFDLSGGIDPEKLKDINLGFTNSVSAAAAQEARAGVPEGAVVLFINLTHDGPFPCPVTRMDWVGGTFRPGDAVYLYYVSDSGLGEEQALAVDENGFITYTVTHASPYMVSNRRQGVELPQSPGSRGDGETAAEDQGTDGNGAQPGNDGNAAAKTAPRTGDARDAAFCLWLAAAAGAAAVCVPALKRRHAKK